MPPTFRVRPIRAMILCAPATPAADLPRRHRDPDASLLSSGPRVLTGQDTPNPLVTRHGIDQVLSTRPSYRRAIIMSMTSPIGSEALIPNPALQPFQALVGEWQTTGTHPYVPDTIFHGRASFAWHEGGAFLIMHSEIDEPEVPSGVAVFGSDDEAKSYFMLYFDERGVSRKYDVTMSKNTLTWRRDEPSFSQRFTIAVEDDGNKMVGQGEMSRDGAAWEDDLSLTYVRAPS
jgi:hypothetical protein